MPDHPPVCSQNLIRGSVAGAPSSDSASNGRSGKSQRKLDRDPNQPPVRGRECNSTNISSGSELEDQEIKPSSGVNSPTPQDTHTRSGTDDTTKGTTSKLQSYSKEYLIRRVVILEHELKKQNSACARLLQQCRALSPLKKEFETQKEVIANQKRQIDHLQAENASSMEKIRLLKKEIRDKEHQERVDRVRKVIGGTSPHPASHAGMGSERPRGALPGGTVLNTRMGPQIVYDSSSISSVGFSKGTAIPLDFLGGLDVQNQLQQRCGGAQSSDGVGLHDADSSEEAELRKVLQKARDEVEFNQKYHEIESREEQELLARLEALKSKK